MKSTEDYSAWKTITYKKIKVYYSVELDGGGRRFVPGFIKIIKDNFGKPGRICEICCGAGFVGFSLLAYGLCDSLILIDVNPKALEACKKTIKANHLEKKVKLFLSDTLDEIPKNEKWDLVVSDPPHFDAKKRTEKEDILFVDVGWSIHKKFYRDAASHLKSNGSVLFAENYQGSVLSTFLPMIKKGGLVYIKTFDIPKTSARIVSENINSWLGLLDINKLLYFLRIWKRMKLRLTSFLNITKDPYYFIWSRKVES